MNGVNWNWLRSVFQTAICSMFNHGSNALENGLNQKALIECTKNKLVLVGFSRVVH